LKRRVDAYKKMFPNLDCVGWYSTGDEHKADWSQDIVGDLHLQKSI
jgi:hypothetical protein